MTPLPHLTPNPSPEGEGRIESIYEAFMGPFVTVIRTRYTGEEVHLRVRARVAMDLVLWDELNGDEIRSARIVWDGVSPHGWDGSP